MLGSLFLLLFLPYARGGAQRAKGVVNSFPFTDFSCADSERSHGAAYLRVMKG